MVGAVSITPEKVDTVGQQTTPCANRPHPSPHLTQPPGSLQPVCGEFLIMRQSAANKDHDSGAAIDSCVGSLALFARYVTHRVA